MLKNEITYYLIEGRLLAKEEDNNYYLFKEGKWEPDSKNVVWDYAMGFDPSEDLDSPYAFENLEIMNSLIEISEEEAKNFAPDAFSNNILDSDDEETLKVIEEARNGIGLSKAYTDINELMDDLYDEK